MNYALLATDMDGTVVNTDNRISPRVVDAIHGALAQGYEVLFATGRCPAEVRPFLKQFPDMRYVICTNGTLVMDLKAGKPLYEVHLEPAVVEQVLDAVRGMDLTAIYYIGSDFYVENAARSRLAHYHCDCFRTLIEECATWVDSPYEEFRKRPGELRKINLFFHDPEEHRIAGERIAGLPVNFPSGVPLDYEICPAGITKGTGLQMLCKHLGLDVRQSIACGDEGNDLDMLKAAGLGVAVGNASAAVKAAADIVTADCAHDGVAEVIETYLGKPVMQAGTAKGD